VLPRYAGGLRRVRDSNLRRERQTEGIAKAKAAGIYKGRKPSINLDKVKELRDQGLGATEIAKRLRIGRASVYRVLGNPSGPRPS